ncbi:hypothetical protein HBH98_238890 [Parastagonospora nodorum]|nr:hypothetical protein HBH52_032100 [Parastagonospora nodorum]KAH4073009.1 hypothetical protein HBH50_048370 [Parastagonospora nodorum]KAH4099935.1 hypothetical protein HBH48_013660 [Parastagonospora nodorum]KAH4108917.1 hypothetical protein HBH46_033830 [Parastagonospora nodorum]KAH4128032.1 hypothetical protein HBH47_043860 [Parastagonospora nodorum]
MQFLLLTLCLALLAAARTITGETRTAAAAPKEDPPSRRRGVAYNNPPFANYFDVMNSGGQVSWSYNWASRPTEQHTSFEFIPMLWSNQDSSTSKWWDSIKDAGGIFKDNPTHLLAFNEPDNCRMGSGGACMSVSDSVAAWRQHMEPAKTLKEKMYLGSPAVTNGGTGMGLDWLGQFLKECAGCKIDFICIHWYDKANNVQYFKDHINRARDVAGGRPIWITELGPQGTDAEIKSFLDQVIPWMEDSGDIHRYAYFMAREGLLVNNQGTGLSDIGSHFTYWRRANGGFTTKSNSTIVAAKL